MSHENIDERRSRSPTLDSFAPHTHFDLPEEAYTAGNQKLLPISPLPEFKLNISKKTYDRRDASLAKAVSINDQFSRTGERPTPPIHYTHIKTSTLERFSPEQSPNREPAYSKAISNLGIDGNIHLTSNLRVQSMVAKTRIVDKKPVRSRSHSEVRGVSTQTNFPESTIQPQNVRSREENIKLADVMNNERLRMNETNSRKFLASLVNSASKKKSELDPKNFDFTYLSPKAETGRPSSEKINQKWIERYMGSMKKASSYIETRSPSPGRDGYDSINVVKSQTSTNFHRTHESLKSLKNTITVDINKETEFPTLEHYYSSAPASPTRKNQLLVLHNSSANFESPGEDQSPTKIAQRRVYSSNFNFPKPRRAIDDLFKQTMNNISYKPGNDKGLRPVSPTKQTSNSRPVSPSKGGKEIYRETITVGCGSNKKEVLVETKFGVSRIVEETPYHLNWKKSLEKYSPIKAKQPVSKVLVHQKTFVSPFDQYREKYASKKNFGEREVEPHSQKYVISLKNLFPVDESANKKRYQNVNMHKIKQNRISNLNYVS